MMAARVRVIGSGEEKVPFLSVWSLISCIPLVPSGVLKRMLQSLLQVEAGVFCLKILETTSHLNLIQPSALPPQNAATFSEQSACCKREYTAVVLVKPLTWPVVIWPSFLPPVINTSRNGCDFEWSENSGIVNGQHKLYGLFLFGLTRFHGCWKVCRSL